MLARALAAKPTIILADEPTGQLDSHTGRVVLNIMRRLVEEHGITIILVTHDPQARDEADVVYQLNEGRIKAQAVPSTQMTTCRSTPERLFIIGETGVFLLSPSII